MKKNQWTILLLVGALLALYYFATQSAIATTSDATSVDDPDNDSGSGWSTVSVQGPTEIDYADGTTQTVPAPAAGAYD